DVEGNSGIINIITQKKVMGYNGNAGVTYSATNNYSASGSLNIKYGKVGLSAYYGLGGGHPPRSFTYSETESLNPVAFYKRISNGSSRSKNFYNFGDIELGWDVDSLTTLSFYAGVNGGNGNSNGLVQYDMILPNNGGKQTSFLKNESRYRYPGYNLGLDYVRKFSGIEGKELAIKTYYNSAKDDSYALSEQDNPGADRFIINDNKAPNKEMTLQADFTQPFNKGKKLETGVKAILRRASSDYVSLIKYDKDEQYEEDKANSNSFSYLQDVFSVFATYSFKWKTFSVKLGSRYEQTKINGDFTKTATRVKQDYGTFLPNIYLSRKFKKIHTVSLSYTRRLRRPYIWDLNPFVFNTDSFNISYGNPDLGPDIINSFEAGYSVFKGNTNINLRLSQNFSNQQIIHYTNFDEVKGVSANVTENAGIARLSGLNLNLSTKFTKKWAFSAGTGIRYTNLENRFRPTQRNHGFGGFGSLNSSYQATKKWSLYSSCNYYVSDPQLQGQQGKNFTYNFGSNYKLFNQKITVAISASNIFNKYFVWKGKLQDENFIRTNESRSVRRNINFSLRWNFGKLTENV
ncbi:MAG: TonB-dependent receptor, partial [Chitinophagaceae bacterium]